MVIRGLAIEHFDQEVAGSFPQTIRYILDIQSIQDRLRDSVWVGSTKCGINYGTKLRPCFVVTKHSCARSSELGKRGGDDFRFGRGGSGLRRVGSRSYLSEPCLGREYLSGDRLDV